MNRDEKLEESIENKYLQNDKDKNKMELTIEESVYILKRRDFNAYVEEIAIETLLTAYEKEKGENVKLRLQDIPLIEGELKAYKDRVNELKLELEKEKKKNKEAYHIGFVDGGIAKKYEFQDKIKAKIEELDYNDISNFERRCKQEILQLLLEKE